MAAKDYPPELIWNPNRGYRCSQCDWTLSVHIQPELPEEDEVKERVRREFSQHVREKHVQATAIGAADDNS